MQWWNEFVDWFTSDEGWRVISSAIIPFLAIVIAGFVAALIGRSAIRRLLTVNERELRRRRYDEEALRRTLTSGRATYYSRSRQEYWRKGDTSGNTQAVVSVSLDCDGDALLLRVDQTGPACHTGTRTCFDGRRLPMPTAPAPGPTTFPIAGQPHA